MSRIRGGVESDVKVHSHASLQRLRHLRTRREAGGNIPDNADFNQRIAGALDTDGDVVIAGPGSAKLELRAYLEQHRPHVTAQVEEVTAGHTT